MPVSFMPLPPASDEPAMLRRRQLAMSLMNANNQQTPVRSHGEGIGRVLQGLAGAMGIQKLDREAKEQDERDMLGYQSILTAKSPQEQEAAYTQASSRVKRGTFGGIMSQRQELAKEERKRSEDAKERQRMITEAHGAIDEDKDLTPQQNSSFKRAAAADPKAFLGKYLSGEFRAPKNYQFQTTGDGVYRVNPDGTKGERWGDAPAVTTTQMRIDNPTDRETWEPMPEATRAQLNLGEGAYLQSSRGNIKPVNGPRQAGGQLTPKYWADYEAKAYKEAVELVKPMGGSPSQKEAAAREMARKAMLNAQQLFSMQSAAQPPVMGAPGSPQQPGPMVAPQPNSGVQYAGTETPPGPSTPLADQLPAPSPWGNGMDGDIERILSTEKPDSYNYSVAYARKAKPQVSFDNETGTYKTTMPDMSMHPKPTYKAEGQQQAQAGQPTVQEQRFAQPTLSGKNQQQLTDARVGTANFKSLAGNFLTAMNDTNNVSAWLNNSRDPNALRLNTAYMNMVGELRVLYNTGVLQPGEWPMMEKALVNPTSMRGLFASDPAIRAQVAELVQVADQKLANLEKVLSQEGVMPSQRGQGNRAQQLKSKYGLQ